MTAAESSIPKGREALIVAGLLLAALAVRIPFYDRLAIVDDEDVYSEFAQSIVAENWRWPNEFMISTPPAYAYLLAATTVLVDGNLATLRAWSIVFGAVGVVALYYLGKEIFGWKVGVLSAVLVCFSSYHILYSRLVMLEAVILLIATVTLLFFWRAYKRNSLWDAIACGLVLGLGLDVKYITFALYPILVLSAVLIGGSGMKPSLRALLDRKFLAVLGISFLVFLPVLLDLAQNKANPFYWQLFQRYELQYAGYRPLMEFTLPELVEHGIADYLAVLTDRDSIGFSKLPWAGVLQFVAFTILLLAVGYSVVGSLRGDPGLRFCLCYFVVMNGFVAVFAARFQYYLLWSVPVFMLMLSKVASDVLQHRTSPDVAGSTLVGLAKATFVVLVLVFLTSSVVLGSAAPFVNESVKGGYASAFDRISRVIEEGDLMAVDRIRIARYYLSEPEYQKLGGENIFAPLFKIVRKRQKRFIEVNTELLETTRPRFIVTDSFLFFSYARSEDITYLKVNYRLMKDDQGILLYERK